MVLRLDTGSVASVQRTGSGGWRIDAAIARTGILEYLRADGSIRREYRPDSEVFSPESLASYEDVPFTVEHPKGLLTPESHAASVGHVRSPRRDGAHLSATIVVNDARGQRAIDAGMREVSCGYECRLDETPGVSPEGIPYDAVQRDIRANHVSLVRRGRAGASVRLRLDSAGASYLEGAVMFRIDGVEYSLDGDDAVKATVASIEAKLAKAYAAAAAAEQRADSAEKEVARRDAEAMSAECASLLGKPGTREDVIAKFLPAVKLDGASEAALVAYFDAARSIAKSAVKAVASSVAAASAPIASPAKGTKTFEQIRADARAERNVLRPLAITRS